MPLAEVGRVYLVGAVACLLACGSRYYGEPGSLAHAAQDAGPEPDAAPPVAAADAGGTCWHEYRTPGESRAPWLGLRLHTPQGTRNGCGYWPVDPDAGIDSYEFRGAVTRVGRWSVETDGCDPAGVCGTFTLQGESTGFPEEVGSRALGVGSVVWMRWEVVRGTFHCATSVAATMNLDQQDKTVLAAGSGRYTTLPSTSFMIELDPLHCNDGPSCGSPRSDDYRMLVRSRRTGAELLGIGTNESGRFEHEGLQYRAFNFRSYQTARICDDYWNYAYWIASVGE